MGASIVYVTTKSSNEARQIGKILVSERFAASVNIFGNIQSMYRWDKQLYDEEEILLIVKTSTSRVDEVIERIRSLHSYQCPCIVTWRLDSGNSAYFDWIKDQTT